MPAHINDEGKFQSDKYPTCPPDKVPLSVNDHTAQDLLWKYAQRRRVVDAEFSDDLQGRLLAVGYRPPRRNFGRYPKRIENLMRAQGIRPPYCKR